MTIRGDGSSLVPYELTPDIEALGEASQAELADTVDALYIRLESDEVDFDTTTGNIEFPFSNGQSDLTGKATWTRIFPDWVFVRLNEMGIIDETRQVQTLVVNGLYKKTSQKLGLEPR